MTVGQTHVMADGWNDPRNVCVQVMNDCVGVLLSRRIATLLNGILESADFDRCNIPVGLAQNFLDVVPNDAFEFPLHSWAVGVTVDLEI